MLGIMRTPRDAVWAAANDRKIYILWVAFAWAMTLGGFALDWTRYIGETPRPPFILHFHGAVYALWLIMVSAQVALIERGNPTLHKSLGWWVVGLTALMVPLGLIAAMVDMARQQGHKEYAPEFLGLEFQSMTVLALVLWAATRMRRDPAAHKRLTMLMVVDLLDPGASRLLGFASTWRPSGPAGWWLSYFWANALLLAAMIAWDWWKRRAVHPVLLWGGLLLAVGEAIAVLLQFNPAWHGAMVLLVRTWGWGG